MRQEEAKSSGLDGSKNWFARGNDDLYLQEALDARVRLRYDPRVAQELRRWVRAAEAHSKRLSGKAYQALTVRWW